MPFLVVCLNPTLQKTLCYPSITLDAVNRTAVHRIDASGKGMNVTRALAQLGKNVVHLTHLGRDLRPYFLSLCAEDNLSVEWVESGSQIRLCYTVLTENDSGVTELVEEPQPVSAGTEKLLLEKFTSLLELDFTCLIISGTKARGYSDEVIPFMVRKAKEKGLAVILDVKGKDLQGSLQYKPDLVKPNLFEFASTFAPELIKENVLIADAARVKERIEPVMRGLVSQYGCRVILTDGGRKIYAACANAFFEVEPQRVKAVNSTGCGDAFAAGFAVAMENLDTKTLSGFREAILEGCRCGALNAGLLRPGVVK